MKYLMLVGTLALGGCLYQDVPRYVIDKAEIVCKDLGGIFEITSSFLGTYSTRCNTGKKITL